MNFSIGSQSWTLNFASRVARFAARSVKFVVGNKRSVNSSIVNEKITGRACLNDCSLSSS